jgi:hypothetical protein
MPNCFATAVELLRKSRLDWLVLPLKAALNYNTFHFINGGLGEWVGRECNMRRANSMTQQHSKQRTPRHAEDAKHSCGPASLTFDATLRQGQCHHKHTRPAETGPKPRTSEM